MKEINVEQRSDEWFNIRLGKITGSHFGDVMPTAKQKDNALSKGQLTYLRKVAAEILTGEREASYTSRAMEWGNEWETAAMKLYSVTTLTTVRECGFYTDDIMIGSSPDGIVGNNSRTFETKCPESKQHLFYYLNPEELYKEYKWQGIGEVYCSEVSDKSGVITSFDPRMPDDRKLVIYDFEPTIEDYELLRFRLDLCIGKIKEWIAEKPIQVDF